MTKSFRLALAFLASLFAGFALPPSAGAQWFDRPLPIDEVLDAVAARGFEPIDRPRLRGDVFVVEVVDPRGRRATLSVDAYDGTIVGSVRARGGPEFGERRVARTYEVRPRGFEGGPRIVTREGGVRDLRDPSTRGLFGEPSARFERAPGLPAPDETPGYVIRSIPLPEQGPLPPERPERGSEIARAPDVREAPALREEPATREVRVPRETRPRVIERERARQREEAPQAQALATPEPAPAAPARAERPAPRPTPGPPRGEALLDDFTPDEIDQMDLFAPRPNAR